MPTVNKSDLKKFSPAINLPKERRNHSKVYHYRDKQTVDEVVGDGIFSNIGNLVSPAIKLISNNKDLIANTAKGAAAVGGLAATIGSIVKANKELEQLQEIRKLRETALNKEKPKISEEAKKKIDKVASLANIAPDKVASLERKGDGIVKF